eukprot:2321945-Rhodomonas_salina.1
MADDTSRFRAWLAFQLWLLSDVAISWGRHDLSPTDFYSTPRGGLTRTFPFIRWQEGPAPLLSTDEIDIQALGDRFSSPKKRLRRGKARVLSTSGSGPAKPRFHAVGFHRSINLFVDLERLNSIEEGNARSVDWDPSPDRTVSGWSLHQTDP